MTLGLENPKENMQVCDLMRLLVELHILKLLRSITNPTNNLGVILSKGNTKVTLSCGPNYVYACHHYYGYVIKANANNFR